MVVDLRDRFRGALLGAALGDAFGAPLEGASPGASLSALVAQRAAQPGSWRPTDDTRMMLDVATWLLLPSEAPEALLVQLADSYDAALGYGHGTKQVLAAYRSGLPWGACPFVTWSEGSKGNGSSARVAPVACRYLGNPSRAEQIARMSSWVTHAHPDAIAGAVLQMHAVQLALGTTPPAFHGAAFLAALVEQAGRLDGWPRTAMARVQELVDGDAAPVDVRACFDAASPLAETTVPVALWAFVSGGPSFDGCVRAAASVGGDVDTVCAMTGALAGSLLGTSRLPNAWHASIPLTAERALRSADSLFTAHRRD